MSKLKEHLTEAKVTQLDRQNANQSVSRFTSHLKSLANETKTMRKTFGPLYGKELKKVEADINKIVDALDKVLLIQLTKTEP